MSRSHSQANPNSRPPSALASLTATYTDSEDEIEDGEGEEGGSPPGGVRGSSTSLPKPPSSAGGHGHGRRRSSKGASGAGDKDNVKDDALVAYHFAQIDDDAIDDFNSETHSDGSQGDPVAEGEDSPVVPDGSSGDPEEAMEIDGAGTETEAKGGGLDLRTSMETSTVASPRRSKIPPEPKGRCSAELQAKFAALTGNSKNYIQEKILNRKDFRNPSIYEKLIQFVEIDEFGTNYPPEIFNPKEWPESSYYDQLAKVQKDEMDRREKERRERTKIEIVSGTVKKPAAVPPQGTSSSSATGAQSESSDSKRKSKWDQKGVMPPLLMTTGSINVPPPTNVLLGPGSAASTGGVPSIANKATVISAFGNLPKKRAGK